MITPAPAIAASISANYVMMQNTPTTQEDVSAVFAIGILILAFIFAIMNSR